MSNYVKQTQDYTLEASLREEINRLRGVANDYNTRLKDATDQAARVFRFLHSEGLADRYIAWQVSQRLEE